MSVNCRGWYLMKTKIIYISGNEVFEMAQIRAAFEEVRNALGLGNDTVLFGVPVDQDNALADVAIDSDVCVPDTPDVIQETLENNNDESTENETEICVSEEIPEIESDITTEIEYSEDSIDETPQTEQYTPEIIPDTPIEEISENDQEHEPEQDTIIPILSVLYTKDDVVVTEPENTQDVTTEEHEENIAIVAEPVPEADAQQNTTDTMAVSIHDIIADEAPAPEHKKTLEELLESMTPLGEDITPDTETESNVESNEDIEEDTDFSISMTDDTSDTDATLAQLASEFAQAQDKIPEPVKPAGNGKIGKLKNILPFKKAKRDDSGLMGDLFGWAGIAANDDDFSIPGFFTDK